MYIVENIRLINDKIRNLNKTEKILNFKFILQLNPAWILKGLMIRPGLLRN